MYSVKTIDDLSQNSEYFEVLKTFCQNAGVDKDNPSYPSVSAENWESNHSSLLYVVSQKRFDAPSGTFQMVYYEDSPVCVSGAYTSDFDDHCAIVGGRSWTLDDHRSKFLIGNYILPIQLDWAISTGHDLAMFTYNLHNTWLAKMILRASQGRALRFGQANSEAYLGWVAHPTLCRIKNTDQIVLYKQLGIYDRLPQLVDVDTGVPTGL